MESALSVKGQATIPKAIREHLHVEPGDRIKFFIHPDCSVVIPPKVHTSVLKGTISPPGAACLHRRDARSYRG